MELTERLARRTTISCTPCCSKIEDEEPERTCFFTYKELKKATHNFDDKEKLGDGGYGVVYKGKLRDKRTVAVKVLKLRTEKSLDQFNNEVKLLSRLRHENLIIFYGCTKPPKELLLVYEFVPNKTLKYHLHDQHLPFVWPLRLQIAIEMAEGLSYLHSSTQIIHRDVKTDNILLDHTFHVKVADFGLCRLLPADGTGVTTITRSTAGYEDPEYKRRLRFTLKSDVYSFGVVLVELLTRKKAVDVERGEGSIFLDEIAPNMILNRELEKLVDPAIGYDYGGDARRIIDSVAELALECLQPTGDMRPSMVEVLRVLKQINDEMQHLAVFKEMINEMRYMQRAQQEVTAYIYTYKELKKATNSFSRRIGEGVFGITYLGQLPDRRMVAVKALYRHQVNNEQHEKFFRGANVLCRYRHENLVAFYGCTSPQDSKDLLLVYEFVPNGTVADHLYVQTTPNWNVRLQIAIETAEAIAYLHSRPLIVHNNITTSIILLDDAFHVKIGGLGGDGFSPWDNTGVSTVQRGTVGYQDPEYGRTLRLTSKSNVYSFGVVLSELLSGLRAIDTYRDEIYLDRLILDKIINNKLDEFVDPRLGYHSDDDVRRMIDSVAVLASKCLQLKANDRPPMIDVLNILKGIRDGKLLKHGAEEDIVVRD